jgi:LysM domain
MIVVEEGQTLKDIAIQHCGSLTALVDIAVLNGISPTAEVAPGTELIIPDVVDVAMVNYIAAKSITPVSQKKDFSQVLPEGIGYWAIGIDNIVQ